jgi:hypothetical protein
MVGNKTPFLTAEPQRSRGTRKAFPEGAQGESEAEPKKSCKCIAYVIRKSSKVKTILFNLKPIKPLELFEPLKLYPCCSNTFAETPPLSHDKRKPHRSCACSKCISRRDRVDNVRNPHGRCRDTSDDYCATLP